MAYTRFFGMRSFENIIRDARFRTPKDSQYLIGEPVVIDPANPGFMTRPASDAAPTAASGLCIFEHIQAPGLDPSLASSSDLVFVPAGRYAQIVHGVGAKFWFKNVAGRTLYDGRPVVGGSLLADSVDITALKPGDGLSPDGAGKYRTSTAHAWLVVEQVNPSTGLVEARSTF